MNLREPRTQRIILVAILSLGVLYAFFFTTYVPFTYKARAAETTAVETELAKLSGDVAKARAAVASMPELERECTEVHERWQVMSQFLPTTKEIAALLTKVTLAGQESGVEFALFKPEAPQSGDFYVTYPTQLRVEGGYHQVGRFLASVANLDRIVNVVDLNMTASDPDEKSPERTVVAACTAEAYAFQENAEKAAAKPAKAEGKK